MIDYLKGKVFENYGDSISLLCGSVAFRLFVPLPLLMKVKKGEKLSLYVHFSFPKEGAPVLYGFESKEERSFFESLLKVHGVGAKVALSIVSHLSKGEFDSIVSSFDVDALSSVPGVGKKLAERIIVEMKGKVERLSVPPELVDVLSSLGYRKREIMEVLKEVDLSKPTNEIVKEAVLKLSKNVLEKG